MQKREERRSPSRPVILDVLPSHLAARLDILPVSKRQKLQKYLVRNWRLSVIIIVILGGIGLTVVRPWQTKSPTLPQEIARDIQTFTPYFFNSGLPQDFKLDSGSLTYAGGLLSFRLMQLGGQTITISEQELPTEFVNTTPQGKEKVDGVEGVASLSTQQGRTVGTLFSADKRTLILVNADASVSTDSIKILMRALKPQQT